ncbi:MAG: hypothetical protein WDN08_13020 [Rhizomicrobium sp.]
MAVKGKMEKMKMSDGAEIGVYRVQPAGTRRGGLVLIRRSSALPSISWNYATAMPRTAMKCWRRRCTTASIRASRRAIRPRTSRVAIKLARAEHPFELSLADTQTCIDDLKARGHVFITGYCYAAA